MIKPPKLYRTDMYISEKYENVLNTNYGNFILVNIIFRRKERSQGSFVFGFLKTKRSLI